MSQQLTVKFSMYQVQSPPTGVQVGHHLKCQVQPVQGQIVILQTAKIDHETVHDLVGDGGVGDAPVDTRGGGVEIDGGQDGGLVGAGVHAGEGEGHVEVAGQLQSGGAPVEDDVGGLVGVDVKGQEDEFEHCFRVHCEVVLWIWGWIAIPWCRSSCSLISNRT